MPSNNATSGIARKANNTTVHVGADRYAKLNNIACTLTAEANRPIAASWFNKYLIDNFSDVAMSALRSEIAQTRTADSE